VVETSEIPPFEDLALFFRPPVLPERPTWLTSPFMRREKRCEYSSRDFSIEVFLGFPEHGDFSSGCPPFAERITRNLFPVLLCSFFVKGEWWSLVDSHDGSIEPPVKSARISPFFRKVGQEKRYSSTQQKASPG
jgi:hypothetical protein